MAVGRQQANLKVRQHLCCDIDKGSVKAGVGCLAADASVLFCCRRFHTCCTQVWRWTLLLLTVPCPITYPAFKLSRGCKVGSWQAAVGIPTCAGPWGAVADPWCTLASWHRDGRSADLQRQRPNITSASHNPSKAIQQHWLLTPIMACELWRRWQGGQQS